MTAISANPLDLSLSQVLLDGSHILQAINNNSSYYSKSLKLAKKAGKGISYIGGAFAGALYSGASLITGSQGEAGKDATGGDTSASSMSTAALTYEDKQL